MNLTNILSRLPILASWWRGGGGKSSADVPERSAGVSRLPRTKVRAAAPPPSGLSVEGVPVLVVTRHAALAEYLYALAPELRRATRLHHVTPDDVRGAVVVGNVPLHIAAAALVIVEIPLRLTPEDRGRELTLEEIRARAGKARAYQVIPQGWSYRQAPALPRGVTRWLDRCCRSGWIAKT